MQTAKLIQSLIDFLKSIFVIEERVAPTVDAAISKFNEALANLRAVQEHHIQLADDAVARKLKAEAEHTAALDEATRAAGIVARLEAIVA